MYAIVDIAGSQFKVEAGNEIFVPRLPQAKDSEVEFDKVLLVDAEGKVKVGAPYVKGAVVKATVIADDVKADKVLVFKKIRRKGFQTLNGPKKVNQVPRTVVSRIANVSASRSSAARSLRPATSLYASAAPCTIPTRTSAWARTTLSMLS